jgi:hypothetical protein
MLSALATLLTIKKVSTDPKSPSCQANLADSKKLKSLQFLDDSLNKFQKEAVRFTLESSEVALIDGPSGDRGDTITPILCLICVSNYFL